MKLNIPIYGYKFWFYCRKAIFQGFLPIFLALLTLIDLINSNGKRSYNHLYFYTSIILFLYSQFKVICKFIFSVYADVIVFKKEINLQQTSQNLLLESGISNTSNHIIIVKKIFKLRYTNSSFFKRLDQICWFVGIDCPILIPYEIIQKFMSNKQEITSYNENEILDMTLNNLQSYHPSMYKILPNLNFSMDYLTNHDTKYPLLDVSPIGMDKTIYDIQKRLFDIDNNNNDNNV